MTVLACIDRSHFAASVCDHERHARLIVMGKGGEAADWDVAHLGRNLERVIRASHKPVLLAAEAYRPIRRYLLAYDGGKSTGEAISYLVESPLLRETEGQVLMVGRGADGSRLPDAVRHLESAGLRVSGESRQGEPEAVIADTVAREGIDLLVMGAYGHSRIRQLMIGSTTTELLHRTAVSMLVFH